MTSHDQAVLAFIKSDADARGLGLREYCRDFGITYTSLRGIDFDLDVAGREVSLDALDSLDDGQDKLERQMLGGWEDEAFLNHLAGIGKRRPRNRSRRSVVPTSEAA